MALNCTGTFDIFGWHINSTTLDGARVVGEWGSQMNWWLRSVYNVQLCEGGENCTAADDFWTEYCQWDYEETKRAEIFWTAFQHTRPNEFVLDVTQRNLCHT